MKPLSLSNAADSSNLPGHVNEYLVPEIIE
jgi:hypothetical protein